MILEFVINIAVTMFKGVLSTFSLLSLPVDMVATLANFLSYGNYVVGTDLLLLFSGSVFLWMGIKLSVGLFIFIWKMLPLT